MQAEVKRQKFWSATAELSEPSRNARAFVSEVIVIDGPAWLKA